MSRQEEFDQGYRGHHRAPGPNDFDDVDRTTFHDPVDMMPDVHEHPEYYDHHGQGPEAITQLRAARGKPDHPVNIYRAVPTGIHHIHPGDWVTPSHQYAREHAQSGNTGEGRWKVLRAQVPAKHLNTEGYMHEWGYNGPESVRGKSR